MIYMLTFPPVGNEKHQARFYIGYCEYDPALRFEHHRRGYGARITAAAAQRHGADALRLVWCIEGTRDDERHLKRQRNHRRFLDPARAQATLQRRAQR